MPRLFWLSFRWWIKVDAASGFSKLSRHQRSYDLCLLVAQELAAQLAKLVRDFFHGFDGLIVVFHNLILRFLWLSDRSWPQEQTKRALLRWSQEVLLQLCSSLVRFYLKSVTLHNGTWFFRILLSNWCQNGDDTVFARKSEAKSFVSMLISL